MTFDELTQTVTEKAANSPAFGNKIKFAMDEGVILLDGSGEQNVVSTDDGEAPCTVKIKLEDLTALLKGELNPMAAFMAGKFKIDGDMGVAMKLASFFG